MSFTVTGTIKQIGQTETVGNNGFQKREIVIEVQDGSFTNMLSMHFTKDKVSKLDAFQPGQKVLLDFNLQSNEHNGKYYLNATAWRISASEAVSTTAQQQGVTGHSTSPQMPSDLPF